MIESLDDRTYELLFAVRRSVRYHERRRRFYEAWKVATAAFGVLGGSAAATAITAGWDAWSAALAASVAVLSALAVGTARRADRHGDFMRQFIALERRFSRGKDLGDDEYREAVSERLGIERTARIAIARCALSLRGLALGGRQPAPENALVAAQVGALAQSDRLRVERRE